MKNVFSLEQFEINGDSFYSISYTVDGYWSNDSISIYVSREALWVEKTPLLDGLWKVSVSHSSGGRDTSVILNDWEAEANFAKTLADVCAFAKDLNSTQFVNMLEEAYQRRALASIKEKEEQEAAIASVPKVSISEAKSIIDNLKKGTVSKVFFNNPGSKVKQIISTEKTASGRNALRYGNSALTYEKAVGILCKAEEETIEVN